jgi:hypothetical protein
VWGENATSEAIDLLVSHEHRFIFIHVPKSAGRSIRQALQPYATDVRGFWLNRAVAACGRRGNLFAPARYRWLRSHSTARQGRAYLPDRIFGHYFKFAFVRNPWDWLVSYYHFVTSRPKHRLHRRIKSMGGFDPYVRTTCSQPKFLQKDFVTDKYGQLMVDFVGRFENLSSDFADVCRRIGVSADLGRRNTSQHHDYREYFSDELRDCVSKAYAQDIELFDYDFDGVRTARNSQSLAYRQQKSAA